MQDSIGLVLVIIVGAMIIGVASTMAFRKNSETGFAILAFAILGIIALAVESGETFGDWIKVVVLLACAVGAVIVFLINRPQRN